MDATGTTTTVATEEQRPVGFLGLMRNRNYALLWWGQFVSEFGNRFHWVAVSLLVFAVTRSAAAVSIGIASMWVGPLVAGLWAGVLVDRLNRKGILILSDLARAGLVALIPTLAAMNIWYVYLDLAVISFASAFFRPAIFSVLSQTVERKDLLPANSFFNAMDTGTEVIGPAIAGLLALKFGYSLLLYADSATFLVSTLCVAAMAIVPVAQATAARLNLRSIWEGMTEGVRYIRRDQLQWGFFVLIFPAYLVGSGLNALQTPLAKGIVRIDDGQFGTMQSVWGIGFVVASLLLGWFGAEFRKSRVILGGYFLAFAATAAMGLSRSFEALAVTAFVVGFANTFYFTGIGTVLMEHTPQTILGRVASSRQFALAIVRVVSPLFFGALAEFVGVRQSILIMAAVGTVGTLAVVLANRTVSRFDAPWQPSERVTALWRVLSGPVDPEIDDVQQRRLNVISLALALGAWLGLLYWAPLYAIGLLAAILGIYFLGSLARRRGWLPS
jgi:MFS family permease